MGNNQEENEQNTTYNKEIVMSTCGICVQPFDFMTSKSAKGHDLCVLQEKEDDHLMELGNAQQAEYKATESYDRLDEEISALKIELSEALAALNLESEEKEEPTKEETELC